MKFFKWLARVFCKHDYEDGTLRHWTGYFDNKRLVGKYESSNSIRYSEMYCCKCKRYVKL
jgi:hypothetical protein